MIEDFIRYNGIYTYIIKVAIITCMHFCWFDAPSEVCLLLLQAYYLESKVVLLLVGGEVLGWYTGSDFVVAISDLYW